MPISTSTYLVSILFFLLLAVSSFITGTLTYYSWVQNLYNHFGELAGFTKGKLSIPFSLGCPLLRAKKKKAYLYSPKDGTAMLLTPLFLIAKVTQVPIYPSTVEWILTRDMMQQQEQVNHSYMK